MSAAPPRCLFVYWRADPATLAPSLRAVATAQAALRARWPGLETRLWQRCDPGDTPTVMETYAAPGGIDGDGQARIEGALAGLTPVPRHVEAFAPVEITPG